MHVSVVFLVFNLLAFKELLKSVVWDLPPAFEDSRRQRLRHLVSSSSLKCRLCPDWCALHVSWASFVFRSSFFACFSWFPLSLGSRSGLTWRWPLGLPLEIILLTVIHVGRLAHQWYRFSELGPENVLYTMYGIKRESELAGREHFSFLAFWLQMCYV